MYRSEQSRTACNLIMLLRIVCDLKPLGHLQRSLESLKLGNAIVRLALCKKLTGSQREDHIVGTKIEETKCLGRRCEEKDKGQVCLRDMSKVELEEGRDSV